MTENIKSIMHPGTSVKMALVKRGKSVAWLSKELNCTKATIHTLIKTGNTTVKRLNQIAAALDMQTSEMLALSE